MDKDFHPLPPTLIPPPPLISPEPHFAPTCLLFFHPLECPLLDTSSLPSFPSRSFSMDIIKIIPFSSTPLRFLNYVLLLNSPLSHFFSFLLSLVFTRHFFHPLVSCRDPININFHYSQSSNFHSNEMRGTSILSFLLRLSDSRRCNSSPPDFPLSIAVLSDR